ncbi:MAG TPA: hypothetical protein ENI15_06430 [Spirochaetes bacterium]|nr:hypothetical protein [Spirochaetota bacterium]
MAMIKSKFLTAGSFSVYIIIFIYCSAFAQQPPSYSFVSFENNYDSILSSSRSDGYQIKAEELNSSFGNYSLQAEKQFDFYSENLFLFFNEKKELIFFTVQYELKKDQKKTILDRLVLSILDKLVEKYGTNENDNFPYYRVFENQYEIVVRPRQSTSNFANISFKQLDKFLEYQEYHQQELDRLENEEISKTVENY